MANRRPWAKLWSEKWLASARVRSCSYAQHGLWLAVAMRLHSTRSDGECRAWTADHVAADLGLPPSRRKRFRTDLAALVEAGLIDQFPDDTLHLPRFEDLQQPPKGANR